MTPTLTIAIPTIGRPSLKHTLDSIKRQRLTRGDRVLVVLDTYNEPKRPDIAELVDSYGPPFELHLHNGGEHFMGNPQFNYAMSIADTEYFCGLGDDDVYVDGAFDRIRDAIEPRRVVLHQFLSPHFQTPYGPRRFVLWDEPVLQEAHISGCCMVAPCEALVPVSDDRRIEVDYDWIVNVVRKTGHEPIWLRECLIMARPEARGDGVAHLGIAVCDECGEATYLEDMASRELCRDCAEVAA